MKIKEHFWIPIMLLASISLGSCEQKSTQQPARKYYVILSTPEGADSYVRKILKNACRDVSETELHAEVQFIQKPNLDVKVDLRQGCLIQIQREAKKISKKVQNKPLGFTENLAYIGFGLGQDPRPSAIFSQIDGSDTKAVVAIGNHITNVKRANMVSWCITYTGNAFTLGRQVANSLQAYKSIVRSENIDSPTLGTCGIR